MIKVNFLSEVCCFAVGNLGRFRSFCGSWCVVSLAQSVDR